MGTITMPAVSTGYFNGGRNLAEGHRFFSNSILQEILAAARVDLQDHESRITVVEGLIAGQDQKASVDLCTAAALNAYTQAGAGAGATLTQNAAAVENIDGTAVVVGDRILVNNDGTATGSDRGIYEVTTVGTVAVKQVLTRVTDADTGTTEVSANMFVWVERGATLADTAWVLTTDDPITVDTTALSFSEFTLSAHALAHERGGDLEIDGDHLDIDFTPAHYSPATTPAEAANVDDLAAHLFGIDASIANRDAKQSVRLATAGALAAYTQAGAGVGATLTANAVGVENIDGVAVLAGDRVLVNNDGTGTGADRGIYTVTTVGDGANAQVLTRAIDADEDAEVTSGLHVRVEEGTVYGGSEFKLGTTGAITVDTTALSFVLMNTTTHPADHERGGILEIDGDHLDIDFTPGNYTPNTTPAEAANVDDLAAHLSGIDVALGGLDRKASVALATAAALPAYTQAGAGVGATLTAVANGALTVDGVAVNANDRILVKDGAAGADNGIYVVTQAGDGANPYILTRALDADDDADVTFGMHTWVEAGTANSGQEFILSTAGAIVVDTTALTFTSVNSLTHALSHERAGLFEINGDHLDIDFTPTEYVPSIAPAEAANVDDLAAHLAGIDDAFLNRSHKQPVRLATAAALGAYTQAGAGVGATLTQNVAAVENIDGTAVVLGDRILVKDGAVGEDNGIYTVTTVGTGGAQQVLTRAVDSDEADELVCGMSVDVEEGTANAGLRFKLATANPITVDTTALTFQQHDAFAPVGDIADVAGAAAAGTADTYARGDHEHKLANLVTLMAHEGSNNVAGNAAAAGTSGTHRTVDYDDGGAVADEEYAWESRMPAHYGGGTMNVKLYFTGAAAAGDVKWNVQFERMNLNGLDIDAGDSYAAAKTVTETVPGTAGQIITADFTFTSVEADSVVADELFRVLVQRHSSDAADTMAGDAHLLAIEISQ